MVVEKVPERTSRARYRGFRTPRMNTVSCDIYHCICMLVGWVSAHGLYVL